MRRYCQTGGFGKNYGVIVIPEGVLEFVNEIQVFIIKLNTIIGEYNQTHDSDFHTAYPVLEDKLEFLRRLARRSEEEGGIAVWNRRDDDLFNDIPEFFQEGLLMERDSHGNFQFSQVETDKVVMGLVKDYLDILKEEGDYKVGIHQDVYRKSMARGGLDPDLLWQGDFQELPGRSVSDGEEIDYQYQNPQAGASPGGTDSGNR